MFFSLKRSYHFRPAQRTLVLIPSSILCSALRKASAPFEPKTKVFRRSVQRPRLGNGTLQASKRPLLRRGPEKSPRQGRFEAEGLRNAPQFIFGHVCEEFRPKHHQTPTVWNFPHKISPTRPRQAMLMDPNFSGHLDKQDPRFNG